MSAPASELYALYIETEDASGQWRICTGTYEECNKRMTELMEHHETQIIPALIRNGHGQCIERADQRCFCANSSRQPFMWISKL